MREELAYCVPLGIPHKEFLSWDEDDQDKALAFMAEKATICRDCGTRDSEWAKDRFAYVADTERCPGCEILEQENDNMAKERADGKMKGVRVFLRRPRPEDDEG